MARRYQASERTKRSCRLGYGAGDHQQGVAQVRVLEEGRDLGVPAQELGALDGAPGGQGDLGDQALERDLVGLEVDPRALGPVDDGDLGAREGPRLGGGGRGGEDRQGREGRGELEGADHRASSGATALPCSK